MYAEQQQQQQQRRETRIKTTYVVALFSLNSTAVSPDSLLGAPTSASAAAVAMAAAEERRALFL